MGPERRVGILVFDGVKLLDVAGPGEVFTEANLFGACYRLVLCSPDGRDVTSSTGMRVSVDAAAADVGMPILQANAVYEFASDRAHMIQISVVFVAVGCAVMWWYR